MSPITLALQPETGEPPAKKDGARNNFNLLRLIAALLVVFGHYKILAGLPAPGIFAHAHLAVDAFFVVSGYLIFASFDRAPFVRGFYIRRFFRIYPAYFVAVLAQAAAMLWLLGDVAQHLRGLVNYLWPNLIFANFLAYDLDHVLAALPNPGINPSLWTLKMEVVFYALVPLIWWLTKRFGFTFLALVYVASCLFAAYALHQANPVLAKQFPGQMRLFIVGIGLYRYGHRLPRSPWIALLILPLCFIAVQYYGPLFTSVYPLVIGLASILFALRLPPVPLSFDISYGVYLFHGPLIQIALWLGWYRDSGWFLLALLGLVTLLACLSETLIELPAIRLGHALSRIKNRQRAPLSASEAAGG